VVKYRIERDSLGEIRVPEDALYGAQTQRAIENFPISGIRFPRAFIRALGLIKVAAAEVNAELGLLDEKKAQAIVQAAQEVADGQWDYHFPIDIFQTGSGTSTNMNANEVIANRATQVLGGDLGSKLVHPNDHVNMGQSSNDVVPSALHLSAFLQVEGVLLPALRHLHVSLERRVAEFDDVVKTGRTHLMDAMPIRLSQEISGWTYQVVQSIERIESCLPRLSRLALGGTAVGTGINAHPEFGGRIAAKLSADTGLPLFESEHHFAAQAAMDTATELSGHVKTSASALMKIANDMRWLNSGPIAGLGEISLPALQPGSSIMPGKINPVICEAVMMVCGQVIGNDLAVTIGNERGNFQLNVMLPLITYNLLQSITILGNATQVLADKAVEGFTVDRQRVADLVEKNPVLVTALNPAIGYDRAAQIAKRAFAEGRRVKDIAAEMTDLSSEELDRLLDPRRLTQGGYPDK
jgi:fumarate hydratase class II